MSHRIPAIFMVLSLIVFSSCSNSKTGNKSSQVQNAPEADTMLHWQNSGSKMVIKDNSSVVSAEIMAVKPEGENDFTLTVLVKNVEDDQTQESLAVKGETYHMKPAFVMEQKEIKAIDKNRKLMELKDLAPGSTFKARVSLTQDNKWIISEVLNVK